MAWGQRLVSGAALVAVVALGSVTLGAQKAPAKAAPAPKGPDVVAVAALQPLLPKMDGWTRGTPGGSVVPISDDQGYSFADAEFTNGEQKVKVTIGDTSSVEDCLLALDGYERVEGVLAALRTAGVRVLEMEVAQPDLEEVFVKIMNH